MVFIGLRAISISSGPINWKNAKVIHFNPHFIKLVDEKAMRIIMDDNSEYRIDDESLQIFLAAMYGDSLKDDPFEDK